MANLPQNVCEAAVRNFLCACRVDGPPAPERLKAALLALGRELAVPHERLNEWYRDWKASGSASIRLAESRANEEAFALAAATLLLYVPGPNGGLLSVARAVGLGESAPPLIERAGSLARGNPRPGLLELQQALLSLTSAPVSSSGGAFVPAAVLEQSYIANQISYEGLDELQRLILARHLGIHVAIDGPPGVGKTQSVREVARILATELFTRTCSGKTSESQIISYPMLVAEGGASITTHVNGPLARAMLAGSIFYGDEFNLLKEDVQKRLNSAFDDRRSIDRADGEVIQARPGFWAVISYNPTRNLVSRDLEDSVADRFIHLHYERWPADFKALVATTRGRPGESDLETYQVKLGLRGISPGPRFLFGKGRGRDVRWFDFFTGEAVSTAPQYVYRAFDTGSLVAEGQDAHALADLASRALSEAELARLLARFTELLQSLGSSGESPLLKKIGLGDLREKEDLELLSIHESSTRIESAALRHYRFLVQQGWNRYLAQSYAVRLVIDQVCYGQYRNRMLREQTVHSLVLLIARAMRLLASDTKYNTKLVTESILLPPAKKT